MQIETLTSEGKVPVVVGGTQLYIELLLWESAVDAYEKQTGHRGGLTAHAESAAPILPNCESLQSLGFRV